MRSWWTIFDKFGTSVARGATEGQAWIEFLMARKTLINGPLFLSMIECAKEIGYEAMEVRDDEGN